MEINKDKLSGNYQYDIKDMNNINDINIKSKNNFEFIREKKLYNDFSSINNIQSKPYSIMDKTNNLLGNNLNDKKYTSTQEQKENIDLFSNQNNLKVNDTSNMRPNMNIIQKEIKDNVNQINKDKFEYLNYESNFEKNRIINNNNNNIYLSNNKKSISNKGFYFNYKNDESFNRLNEKNIKAYPLDIKFNSLYKKEATDFNDNFNYRNNFYLNELNKKEKNKEINEDIFNYKENTKELVNKNSFKSLNINYITNSKDDFSEYNTKDFNNININNNLRFKSMSVNKNINTINPKKLNLDYNEDNIDIKPNKINNINNLNKINITNDTFYNTEKMHNIKSYFQLNQKETKFNDISLNNTEKIDYQDNNDNISNLKSLRKYNSFSVPKNLYINHKKEENYNITNIPNITIGNNNTRDEMTQTNQIIEDNKFYSLTQNRNYRNNSNLDISNNINTFNTFSTFTNKNLIEINDNDNYNENKQDEYNKKIFNTSFNNNRLQQSKCIHKCNSYRNNNFNNYNFGTFNKSNKNNEFNDNRNICKKCLRAKMNLVNLNNNFNNMRICKNCQNFINSRNLINYFSVNK